MLYLDACAVVKRYVDEHDGATAIMEEIMMDAAPWGGLIASEWLVLEVTSTLAKKLRTAQISERAYRALLRRFRTDAEAIDLIPVDSTTVDSATRLMEQAGTERSLHSGDAVHLYTAIQVRDAVGAPDTLVVVSADKGLNGVATSHGLVVFDPRLHSIADLEALFGR
ncbi:MAG TPA: type II toxin-antitoxin system VapC family toxin [Longimicrobium sp.]|nr:type II toxin-antitoxin system VapC family toxin [Longimicrobium sp.]